MLTVAGGVIIGLVALRYWRLCLALVLIGAYVAAGVIAYALLSS